MKPVTEATSVNIGQHWSRVWRRAGLSVPLGSPTKQLCVAGWTDSWFHTRMRSRKEGQLDNGSEVDDLPGAPYSGGAPI
jgi:hypothetical protein